MELRRGWWRLFLAGAALWGLLACGDSSCGCVAPLERPLSDGARVYDAVQTRITPAAFSFIESNLANILAMFLQDGLVFTVPRSDQRFCAPPFNWPCFNIRICQNGCVLTAAIQSATIGRQPPDTLPLSARLAVSGTITLDGDLDCDFPININNKLVRADIKLLIDSRDHFLTFDVANVQLSFSSSDYSIQCPWWYDWLFELLKGTITNMLNDQIGDQLDSAIDDQLAEATCLPCDFYTAGCPAGSSCNGDFCVDSQGHCLTRPLGMAGKLDLAELLGGAIPGMQASLDLLMAAGQWLSAAADPVVPNQGVEVRVIGGADAARHPCVPLPEPGEIPPNTAPPRLAFTDVVPGTDTPYQVGIGVSDAFVDWMLYKAQQGGALCLSIGSDTTDMLSSSTLSALMGSLDTLTAGRNVPVLLKITPTRVPRAEVGAGTFTTDPDGNRVVADPLLHLFLDGLAIDFYARLDERWTRLVRLTQDVALDVAIDFTPDNRIVPMFGEDSIHIENVRASHYELLSENPAALEQLVPMLVSFALPMLTGAIDPIEIPPIEGFALTIRAVQGDMPRAGTPYFEFIGLYADLAMAPVNPVPRRTLAAVEELRQPDRALMSIRNPSGPKIPEVVLRVGADVGPEAEFSVRVDGGAWHPFVRGPRITVRDWRLSLLGPHTIQVRARTVGDYRSLDMAGARVAVVIDPPADPVLASWIDGLLPRPAPVEGTAALGLAAEPEGAGCATAGGGSVLALPLLWIARRRRPRGAK